MRDAGSVLGERQRMGQVGRLLYEGHDSHSRHIITSKGGTSSYRKETRVHNEQTRAEYEETFHISLLRLGIL
jgi:hypothetical protein